jgi:hypothetical protein
MDKSDPPESFGVFKPVGHTVIVFRNAADLDAAVAMLLADGFEASALVRYTPQEMTAQVAVELADISPLAQFGYEIELVREHRVLAEAGRYFLIVHAPDDAQTERVDKVVQTMKATSAQRYGRFVVEELKEEPQDRDGVPR